MRLRLRGQEEPGSYQSNPDQPARQDEEEEAGREGRLVDRVIRLRVIMTRAKGED